MKKRLLLILIFFLIGIIIIFFITEKKPDKWIYKKLPNNYVIEKFNDTKVILGKYKNKSLETTVNKKKIGVDDYIAEFCYGKNYIGLKCLKTVNDNIEVLFYIIDTKNEDIYGPYENEETYNEVLKKIVDEKLGNWIETIKIPKEAIKK